MLTKPPAVPRPIIDDRAFPSDVAAARSFAASLKSPPWASFHLALVGVMSFTVEGRMEVPSLGLVFTSTEVVSLTALRHGHLSVYDRRAVAERLAIGLYRGWAKVAYGDPPDALSDGVCGMMPM